MIIKDEKICEIDFEFNQTSEEKLQLVCCCLSADRIDEDYWLYDSKIERKQLAQRLETLAEEGYVFLAHNCVAEASAIYSLEEAYLDITKLKFVDTFLEYRCLSNHNHQFAYGKQYVDGKVKMTFPPKPKWEQTEKDKQTSFKQKHSLSEMVYKLLGEKIDTDRKNYMRDIIIADNKEEILANKEEILEYCLSDIQHLKPCYHKIKQYYLDNLPEQYAKNIDDIMLNRGKYSALTALMERWGYPVNIKAMKNFSAAVPSILFECQREINELFPDIKPFEFKKNESRYSWTQKKTRDWIRTHHPDKVDGWMLTDGGKSGNKDLSLSLDAFKRFFDFRHEYPKDNLGAQIVRFLTLKQNLNGFSTGSKSTKKTIWDYVGKDGRVRPYMNIFGAQSSRSQPSATSFLFLKSAWMRVLAEPPKGKALAGIDYGSEEFLLSALESKDKAMLEAYRSGDVYLYYAKSIGLVPKDGERKDYEKERDIAKPVVLAMSYLMSKYGLSKKLTMDTGKQVDEEDAQDYIDLFYETFYDLKLHQEEIVDNYELEGKLVLKDGWVVWGDNDNFRSITNVPIQGMGGVIMRKAVELAIEKGLKVVFTLHDALYIEYDLYDYDAIDELREAMFEAFIFYYEGDTKEQAKMIRMDAVTWSNEYQPGKIFTPEGMEVEVKQKYVDGRAKKEYEKFKKFFDDRDEDLI